MQVTNVKVDNYNPKESGTCAECTVVLDNELCIHKVLVVKGEKGEFVAFPNTGNMKLYKNKKRYMDIVHPIDKTLTQNIKEQVLKAYYSYN